MATILGIGVGIFVLAFVWVLCLFICVAVSRAQGGIAYAGIGTIIVAIVITLVLWFLPRGDPPIEDQFIKFDEMYVPRTVLISMCGIFLFLGLVFYTFLHVFEQQRAGPLKKLKVH